MDYEMNLITAVEIPDKSYIFNDNENKGYVLKNIKKVNIFTGPNNSGKSRLLRKILSTNANEFNYHLASISIEDTNACTKKLKEKLVQYFNNRKMQQPEIIKILDEIQSLHFFNNTQYLDTKLSQLKILLKKIEKIQPNAVPTVMQIYNDSFSGIGEGFEEKLKPPNFKKVYIPILRGLRPISLCNQKIILPGLEKFDHKDIYKIRTQVDYFKINFNIAKNNGPVEAPDSNDAGPVEAPYTYPPFEIFTGIDLYEDIKKMLLGTKEERERIRDFEKYLSSNFFENVEVTLTPKHDSDVLNITLGKEERSISDLGDGLQTIIICTFPIFKYENENLLLFIEEPEIYLHPGMQRKMMDVFSDKSKKHQIFLTTHSNHLLDITLDYNENINIFSFEKQKDGFSIKNVSRNKEILDLIGVRNSSVFLSNCIIWVEQRFSWISCRHN